MNVIEHIRRRFRKPEVAAPVMTPVNPLDTLRGELAALRAEVNTMSQRLAASEAAVRRDFKLELGRIGQWESEVKEHIDKMGGRLTALEALRGKPVPDDLEERLTVVERLLTSTSPASSRTGSKMDLRTHEFGNRVRL